MPCSVKSAGRDSLSDVGIIKIRPWTHCRSSCRPEWIINRRHPRTSCGIHPPIMLLSWELPETSSNNSIYYRRMTTSPAWRTCISTDVLEIKQDIPGFKSMASRTPKISALTVIDTEDRTHRVCSACDAMDPPERSLKVNSGRGDTLSPLIRRTVVTCSCLGLFLVSTSASSMVDPV